MIPKIIHYCWFGGKAKTDVALKCIESWKTYAPDFEIKEWNEYNSKPFQNKFYKDAFRKKRFAFVADTVRVSVLYKYGGIYMDLDMLLLKPIDHLLSYQFFSAYEVKNRIAFGFFGGVSGHRFFKTMHKFYESNHFNQFSLPVITHTFSEAIHQNTLYSDECILEPEYFYPLTYENRLEDYKSFLTSKSIAVHLWDHSWSQKVGKESIWILLKNIHIVMVDYLFFGYPKSYLKRYVRGFSRKIVNKILGRS
ncbi:glycosyltransferase family 32 protein [Winogradskyella sp.]|uniref:glycosyltransferase family 32 protein n=1 Tax=Winogradskyella sp. TaxID=1883156 RepID=UPI002639D8CA|nr:glycosyltransferase [Winogradskyella sp.]